VRAAIFIRSRTAPSVTAAYLGRRSFASSLWLSGLHPLHWQSPIPERLPNSRESSNLPGFRRFLPATVLMVRLRRFFLMCRPITQSSPEALRASGGPSSTLSPLFGGSCLPAPGNLARRCCLRCHETRLGKSLTSMAVIPTLYMRSCAGKLPSPLIPKRRSSASPEDHFFRQGGKKWRKVSIFCIIAAIATV